MKNPPPQFDKKIVKLQHLQEVCRHLPRPLVFTNGVFDILHRGHVTYLDQARQRGASLLVALNSDASVKRLGKGPDRPINSENDRIAVIAALACVDIVTHFDDDTPLQTILCVEPDILIKGGDWPIESMVGANEVLARGGKVFSIPFDFERSTTSIVQKIRQTAH